MEIYNYHPTTKDFLGACQADESPLEPGIFLIPANATSKKPPKFNSDIHICKFKNGKWITEKKVIQEEVKLEPEIKDFTEINIQSLWKAATQYEQSLISGSMLITLSVGVIKDLPKSLKVKQWINNIWNNYYYPRKSKIPKDVFISEELLNFSQAGVPPYSVQELLEEVGI